jgi:hypothetical protein
MTNGGAIFTLGEAGLIKLAETAYSTESVLQEYLQKHSDLIPGDQISPDNPRRWLHVAREIGVPDALDGKGRWALDHLFLDQEAIPTLIEVKRSTDTRIRREVVGQLLDYAANGRAYWTETSMREAFSSTCASLG